MDNKSRTKKKMVKIRIYPNKSQIKAIFEQFNNHKNLYNLCLEQRKNEYETKKQSISCYDQIKEHVQKFKQLSNYSSLQQTVRRLDKAFQNFFRRIKNKKTPGYPRFKSKFSSIDFTYGDGCKIKNKKVYFQHIGKIKGVFHTNVENPNRTMLVYKNGCFYACFIVEYQTKLLNNTNKSVGIDFGLRNLITTSENKTIDNPRFHKKYEKALSKQQSKRSKLDKKTKEYKQKTKIIGKIWNKICNCRHDFNHKLANEFVKNYDIIALENLSIERLKNNIKNINKAYSDVCWNQFTNILSYKAENAGRKIVFVNPKNTSKTCFGCGKIHNLSLNDRKMNCECGNTLDRDYNAALNILGLGLQSLAKA